MVNGESIVSLFFNFFGRAIEPRLHETTY